MDITHEALERLLALYHCVQCSMEPRLEQQTTDARNFLVKVGWLDDEG